MESTGEKALSLITLYLAPGEASDHDNKQKE
jgi:hypothetical protein